MTYAKSIGKHLANLIVEMLSFDEMDTLHEDNFIFEAETHSLSHIKPDQKLPDNAQWQHRFEVKSSSSNRKYVIAQNKDKRHWGCSCPGWRTHRNCKHLAAVGLPSHERPHEVAGDDK